MIRSDKKSHADLLFIFFKVWYAVIKTNAVSSRNDFYKCLALMALGQQGKAIDEKLLDNYNNRGIIFYMHHMRE